VDFCKFSLVANQSGEYHHDDADRLWTEPSKPIQHQWRPYDEISTNLKRAVVTAEDGKFMHHHGFDWDGIQTALSRNKNEGRVVAGGSTISQQLAKNLFLVNKRSFLRKGQEAVATWMMERMWSKERILEVYLNSIEFGDNIYGAEAQPNIILVRLQRA
jgi:monofunctional biosynthetic peptidoglycan transglycosylase